MPRTRGQSAGGGGAGGAPVVTGEYTGDGNPTQAVAGVGFQPILVIIYTQILDNANVMVDAHKSDQDGIRASVTLPINSAYYFINNIVISLDADGFTVGNGYNNGMNAVGVVYTYIAFGAN